MVDVHAMLQLVADPATRTTPAGYPVNHHSKSG
ncbi:hypothetical protein FrEUN1fDRAFT_0881, partial [Parafrankia sp. EUN1f]